MNLRGPSSSLCQFPHVSLTDDTNVFLRDIFLCMVFFMITLSGCHKQPELHPDTLSDRLVHILISKQLISTSSNPQTSDEYHEISKWMRSRLSEKTNAAFLLNDEASSIDSKYPDDSFRISGEIMGKLQRLQQFFKNNEKVDRRHVSEEAIREAVLNPVCIERILELIHLDAQNELSETGGLVTLIPMKKELLFLPVVSDNQEAASRLIQVADRPEEALHVIMNMKDEFPFMGVRFDRAIDVLKGSRPAVEKLAHLKQFTDLFISYSRYSYILSQNRQYAAIADTGPDGIYLGLFHVHPPRNTPSPEDHAESVIRRNFIIVPLDETDFDVYFQFLGSTGQADPVRIQYRSGDF